MSAGFLCFVVPFLSDQYEAIVSNSTLVETFQETHGERTDFMTHWREAAGARETRCFTSRVRGR